MSDDAQTIMTIFALDTAGAYCGMCGAKVCPHTAQGVTELIRMANEPPPERAILTDLIGKVRREHVGHDYALQDGKFCMRCQVDWPCPTFNMADRAEARLKEIGGNDV